MEKPHRIYLAGIITGFLNGLLGAGGGLVLLLFLKRSLELPAHKAHATALAVMLPLSVLSSFIYVGSADISFKIVLWLVLGGMVGGYIGARILKKVKPRHLGKMLGVILIFSAMRMIFG
ncbi:MAG: sulfite exporter TauE/SafE family protein [Defluviitaleaceae bacterium]|nr:sulfite exporter TauE/SafE family protein [Defluviitaleaceae bacterium]